LVCEFRLGNRWDVVGCPIPVTRDAFFRAEASLAAPGSTLPKRCVSVTPGRKAVPVTACRPADAQAAGVAYDASRLETASRKATRARKADDSPRDVRKLIRR